MPCVVSRNRKFITTDRADEIMKLGKSCRQCRVGKRRCDRTGTSCSQCSHRNLPCSLATTTLKNANLSMQTANPEPPVNRSLPPPAVVQDLCDLYIWNIHDKPHTLFHEPTLRRSIAKKTVPEVVLYGILGLSARFSPHAEIRAQGGDFTMESKRLLKADLEHICLENVQACILVGNICGADTNADSESLFFGIAMRMARLLHLAEEAPADDGITRETKRRVWWTLYMIDRWSSAGLGLPRQFHNDFGNPGFPMDELAFHHLKDGDPTPSASPQRPGLWAHMITLATIFGHVQDLNQHLAREDLEEACVESTVGGLAENLERFAHELPSDVQLTFDNLAVHARQGLGRTFVALHLGFHHYATLLYFQYLDTQRSASPKKTFYATRCKEHAAAFSDLLRTSYEYKDCAAIYNIVAHMTVVSSSVLLHTLLFGEDDELPSARRRLESNFEVLVKLRTYWPSARLMMDRLSTFQDACFWSASSNTHKVDKWMVKFLLQHALALDEKTEELQGSLDSSSFVSAEAPQSQAQRLSERGRFTTNALSGLLAEYPPDGSGFSPLRTRKSLSPFGGR